MIPREPSPHPLASILTLALPAGLVVQQVVHLPDPGVRIIRGKDNPSPGTIQQVRDVSLIARNDGAARRSIFEHFQRAAIEGAANLSVGGDGDVHQAK